jgi:hypothetical protein
MLSSLCCWIERATGRCAPSLPTPVFFLNTEKMKIEDKEEIIINEKIITCSRTQLSTAWRFAGQVHIILAVGPSTVLLRKSTLSCSFNKLVLLHERKRAVLASHPNVHRERTRGKKKSLEISSVQLPRRHQLRYEKATQRCPASPISLSNSPGIFLSFQRVPEARAKDRDNQSVQGGA